MGSRPTIIAVVEDDASMLRSIVRLLSVSGYLIETYPSAEAFLEKLANSEASLLLLDIHLGGDSGIELHRRLSAAGLSIPTIFMTALDDEETEKEARAAGCIAYLQKPFSPTLLIEAIEKAAA